MKPPFLLSVLLAITLLVNVIPRVRLISPEATPLFEDRYGEYLSEGRSGDSGAHDQMLGFWEVPSPPPSRIRDCILIIEDKRFYRHSGIDLRAALRAFHRTVFRGESQGACRSMLSVP